MKISEHCTYKEGIRSTTALRLGIDNTPDIETLKAMELVAEKVFEPVREFIARPIRVNSFFRSKALNTAIGGSKTSQHMKGQAMDIDIPYGHEANAKMFDFIKDNLDFDQLIWEFGDDKNPDWIHVSYACDASNRNIILKAVKENGRTKYIRIDQDGKNN
jgi:hypothetical protein